MAGKKNMTVEDVQAEVQRIDSIKWDYEKAHSAEDTLYADVLSEIARRSKGTFGKLAAAALETSKLEFSRHCA